MQKLLYVFATLLILSVFLVNCGGSSSSTSSALTDAEITVLSGVVTSSSTTSAPPESAAITLAETVGGSVLEGATVTATIASSGEVCGTANSDSTGAYIISLTDTCKTAVNNGNVVIISATKETTTDSGGTKITTSTAYFNMKDTNINSEKLNVTPQTTAVAAIIATAAIENSIQESNMALATGASDVDREPINTAYVALIESVKDLDVTCPVVDYEKTETQSAEDISRISSLNCADALLASDSILEEQKTVLEEATATLPEISEAFYTGQMATDPDTGVVTEDGFSGCPEFGLPPEFKNKSERKAFVPNNVADIDCVTIYPGIDFTGLDITEWNNTTFHGVDMSDIPGNTLTDSRFEDVTMVGGKIFKGEITVDKDYAELSSFCTAGATTCDSGEGQLSVAVDCKGVGGGGAVLDACGVCDGPGETTWYEDKDGDGLGNPDTPKKSCEQPEGYVITKTDQDDTVKCESSSIITYYADVDGDGLGDPDTSMITCKQPDNYVTNNTDSEPNCKTNDTDVCGVGGGPGKSTYYADADGDGLGNPDLIKSECTQTDNYVTNNTDSEPNCKTDDTDVCGVCAGPGKITYYEDTDGDELGEPNSNSKSSCLKPENYVENNKDTFIKHDISTSESGAWFVSAIDLDTDGDIDVISGAYNSLMVWYENDGSEEFTRHNITTSSYTNSAYAIDLDGDGAVDLVSSDGKNTISWYKNNGDLDPGFSEIEIETNLVYPESVYALDFDGDDDIDVIFSSSGDGTIAWYENDGSEEFTRHNITTSSYTNSVYAVDFDGDGSIDVLSNSYNTVDWYENDGSEEFTTHNITTEIAWSYFVYAIDIDGDGDIDALSASRDDHTIAWYENNGSEDFKMHNITTSAFSAISAYAIDIDGDKDIDVLSASASDDTIAWYENDGSEQFTRHNITTSADSARSVYAIDLDGDGDMDVLSASANDKTIAWYENIMP